MPEPILIDPQGKVFDPNGIRVTMPFLVSITATFIVEAHSKQQAAMAIQRSTSFSGGIAPYMLGIEMGADLAPPELLLKLKGKE